MIKQLSQFKKIFLGNLKNLIFSSKPGLKSSSVCRYRGFHDLDLPPFQNNVGVVPSVVTSQSSQWKKIEIDENLQQSSDFYRLITERVKIYLGKSLNEFQTYLRLVGMSEIQARKCLLRLYFSEYLPATTECNYKSEPFLLLCAKRRVLERNLCVQWFPHFSLSCLLISDYSWMLTYAKKQQWRTSVIYR